MQKRTLVVLLFLTAFGFAQNSTRAKNSNKMQYPVLTYAEMPIYPRVPLTAHISGAVTIQVTVEDGTVTDAKVKSSSSPFLSNPAITNVKTWRFEATANAMFVVKYIYRIHGRETAQLENPQITVELPRLVIVTARPIKPSCSDCRGKVDLKSRNVPEKKKKKTSQ